MAKTENLEARIDRAAKYVSKLKNATAKVDVGFDHEDQDLRGLVFFFQSMEGGFGYALGIDPKNVPAPERFVKVGIEDLDVQAIILAARPVRA